MSKPNPLNNPKYDIEEKPFEPGFFRVDFSGKVIGNYEVVAYAGEHSAHAAWKCRCLYCGKEYLFRQDTLASGKVRSCGCCPETTFKRKMFEDLGPIPMPKRITVHTEEGKKLAYLDDTGLILEGQHYTPEETVEKGWYCTTTKQRALSVLASRGYALEPKNKTHLMVPIEPELFNAFAAYCGASRMNPADAAQIIITKWIKRNCKVRKHRTK